MALPQNEMTINLLVRALGIRWPQLDEDISVEGILAGRRSHESREVS
jgi:hypothetical protein